MLRWLKRHPMSTAMLAMCLIVSPGYYRLEQQANGIEAESRARSAANCDTLNEVKQLIGAILTLFQSATPTTPVPRTPDQQKRDVELLKQLSTLLKPKNCENIGERATAAKVTVSLLLSDLQGKAAA